MNTLSQIKDLLTQYVSDLQLMDTVDQQSTIAQTSELHTQLMSCYDLLRESDPVFYQVNWPTYLSDDDAVSFKRQLRDAASHRFSLDLLPTGNCCRDSINDEFFCSPAFQSWQDTNNPCRNFVIHYDQRHKEDARKLLNQTLLNMFLGLPVKKLNVSLFDFGMTGLTDLFSVNLPPQLYHDTIVVDGASAHERLKALLEHMSLVMKKYGDLVTYNNLHHEIAVPYEVVVLADYPNHYDTYIDELMPLFQNGPRCGIYFILLHNRETSLRDKEQKHLLDCRNYQELGFVDKTNWQGTVAFTPFAENPLLLNVCFDYIREEAVRVEKRAVLKQDFAGIRQQTYEPVLSEISVTVGLDVETKVPVTLRFNSGDYIHAFILGQSGSGKSVLLNNIITTAISKYAPEDLMLYLLDFKGVEFNRYRGVKHTKAVLADNGDPQMTLEVLRELREENKRRVKLWQQNGVNNIDGYNNRHPQERLPQILFVADECQVMFRTPRGGSSQMMIQREIAEIIDIIATQGRSQGIHMLLATQQLDEADISGQVLKNLTECFLLMSAPNDSDRLVPDSSEITAKQPTGQCCYYHKKELQAVTQTFYAKDAELEQAIDAAQKKAASCCGNGEAYFCGSSMFSFGEAEKTEIEAQVNRNPLAIVGRNIGLSGTSTRITLQQDFAENILFFGANKQEQTVGVMMNALLSLILSYQQMQQACDFLVIDCLPEMDLRYRKILSTLEAQGLVHIIDRQRSARTFKAIAEDVRNNVARPVVLCIIGNERFAEMKRNLPLESTASKEETMAFGELEPLSFGDINDLGGGMSMGGATSEMTFQQALNYILDEGPMQGVHTLLQVDKPGNILFEGDFGLNATDKFRHKVILRSENKYLQPMRFSADIDVEILSDEEEHLRAYYYPEGDDPQLFTPFLMPDSENL